MNPLVISLLSELPSIIKTAGSAIKELKAIRSKTDDRRLGENERIELLERAIELQTKLNEQLEQQMTITQAVLESTQKSLRMITMISYAAVGISVVAVIMAIAGLLK
jgi:Sec-independent protein translocase protein TatA